MNIGLKNRLKRFVTISLLLLLPSGCYKSDKGTSRTEDGDTNDKRSEIDASFDRKLSPSEGLSDDGGEYTIEDETSNATAGSERTYRDSDFEYNRDGSTDADSLDTSLRDADDITSSENDAGDQIDDFCSEYAEILKRESCSVCLGEATGPATVPGCYSERLAFSSAPCEAYYNCMGEHCFPCHAPPGCEPDVCDCVTSCLPVERGECHERWETYARCLISQCGGTC